MEEVVVDNALLGDVADPHKMQTDLYMELKKSAYAEFRTYVRSKEQLLGIIKSMTDKPLDEKTNSMFQSQSASFAERLATFNAIHTAEEISRFVEMKIVNLS